MSPLPNVVNGTVGIIFMEPVLSNQCSKLAEASGRVGLDLATAAVISARLRATSAADNGKARCRLSRRNTKKHARATAGRGQRRMTARTRVYEGRHCRLWR